jgi:hypothetical protein
MATTRAELLAALTANDLQIKQAVAIMSGMVSNAEWNRAYDRILQLRKLQEVLRDKIAAM